MVLRDSLRPRSVHTDRCRQPDLPRGTFSPSSQLLTSTAPLTWPCLLRLSSITHSFSACGILEDVEE